MSASSRCGPISGGRRASAAAAGREKRDCVYGPGGVRPDDLGWSADHLWPQTAFLPDRNPARLFGVARPDARTLDFIGSVGRIDQDFARLADLLSMANENPTALA